MSKAFGSLDIAVFNPPTPAPGSFLELSEEDFAGSFHNLVLCFSRLVRRVVPQMRERRWGRIVTIGAACVKQPMRGQLNFSYALANINRRDHIVRRRHFQCETGYRLSIRNESREQNVNREFDGKVALVTGAAGGIGRAISLAFARAGARLAITDADPNGLESTAAAVRGLGTEVLTEVFDVTHDASVAGFVARVVAEFGRLDCAVNNAGIRSEVRGLADFSEEEFDRVIAINLKSVWLCMKHEIRAMLTGGGGAIVNIASGAGLVAVPGAGSYVASKHGVIGLTRCGAPNRGTRGTGRGGSIPVLGASLVLRRPCDGRRWRSQRDVKRDAPHAPNFDFRKSI